MNIFMSREKWKVISKKGFRAYFIRIGVLQIGTQAGFIFLMLKYILDIWPKIEKFSLNFFILEYLVFLPFFVFLGIASSVLIWTHYESKYEEN